MRATIKLLDDIQDITEYIGSTLIQLSFQGKRSVALSGGSTPRMILRLIAEGSLAEKINWKNLHFFWGDERCVHHSDGESNYGEAHRLLFSRVDIPDSNIHSLNDSLEPEEAASAYEEEILSIVSDSREDIPVFDWILLGIGEDGHTASIFPGDSEGLQTDKICIVAKHPETRQKRVSLSMRVINQGRKVSFLVIGEQKAEMVRKVRNGEDCSLPAALVSPVHGSLEYILDRDSASLL